MRRSRGNTDPRLASRGRTVDTTAPTVTQVVPPDGTSGVSVATNVQGSFSEPIHASTLTTSSLTLTRSGDTTPVAATVSYEAASKTAKLDPSSALAASTSYAARVTTGVRDVAGNALVADRLWSFTTSDAPPSPPAAIAREATSTTANATATASLTIAKPGGTVAGDVACLALNGGNVTATGVPAGWSPIAAVTSITNPHVFGYYRVAGAAEPADYTWRLPSRSRTAAGSRATRASTPQPRSTEPRRRRRAPRRRS